LFGLDVVRAVRAGGGEDDQVGVRDHAGAVHAHDGHAAVAVGGVVRTGRCQRDDDQRDRGDQRR